MSDRTCSVEGCVKTLTARGMCPMHWRRWRVSGGVPRSQERRNGVELCSVDGCEKVTKAYLLCVTHATRFGRTGQTERPPGTCTVCGSLFVRTGSRQKCCSPECRRELVARYGYLQRRKSREKTQTTERFTRREVFERDNWVCQLCHEPIDREARPRASRSASLDHIIPLLHGGEHSRENTQCAHFGCNSRKGARMKTPT